MDDWFVHILKVFILVGMATLIFKVAKADDWQKLQSVQHRVNAGISYNKDAATPPSQFRTWPKEGACGDFAKTKAFELEMAGFTPDRMKTVLCRTWDGRYHAYLLVDGKWALDQRFENVIAAGEEDCK